MKIDMTTQKTKPILFSTEMVQAILAGRKTQTRRVIKEPMTTAVLDYAVEKNSPVNEFLEKNCKIKEGDILWVRETYSNEAYGTYFPKDGYFYKADNSLPKPRNDRFDPVWKPSIHMPKEAARIFLKVTHVRVERLQDISEEDAIAEGVVPGDPNKAICFKHYGKPNRFLLFAKQSFETLWQSINGKKYPWDTNPWVWVYTFEQTEKPDNFLKLPN